jgi:heptosyltransferase-1
MDKQLTKQGISNFAILNPGAGWGAKRWPAERYGHVARALAATGVRSILNYGPGEEGMAQQAEAASEGAAVVMKSSITELIALTRRARLFVGGDTGPMHLAAALNVPVVGIFGPTDPARNGPYGTRSIPAGPIPTKACSKSAPTRSWLPLASCWCNLICQYIWFVIPSKRSLRSEGSGRAARCVAFFATQ